MAIIFDLDGVLVDSTQAVERAWTRWAQDRGIDVQQLLPAIHGRPSREVIAEYAPDADAADEARRLDEMEEGDGHQPAFPGAAECVAVAQRGAWAVVTS